MYLQSRDRLATAAVVAVFVLGAAGVTALVALRPTARDPITARGGRSLMVGEIRTPHYMQTDRRWGSEMLGRTVESMAESGCTVCCASMALARFGVDVSPGELNRRLRRANGFTIHGWLRWSMIERLTGGRLVTDVPNAPEHEAIDEALEEGWPVLTRILLRGGVPHWVLIVAKDGHEYLARDPLVAGRLVRVSERSRTIESIRIVHPA